MRTGEALRKLPALLRGRFSYDFDGMPLGSRSVRGRRRRNLLKCGLDTWLGRDRMRSLPPTVQIEPTNHCNLNCPLCPTGTGAMSRPRGFMSMETFGRILDELGETLVTAVLYGWGEPFLHPEMPRMIEACTQRGILTVSSTNGHCLQSLDEALRVVDAGLSALAIAVDGSTEEAYTAYRKSGRLEKVKRCAGLIAEAKERRGAVLPYTNLRVVVTRHNEGDLENLEALARRLGVNMFSCKSLGCLTSSEDYPEYEAFGPQRRAPGPAAPPAPVQCHFPFRQPCIFHDGTVVGCEFDYDLETPWGRIGERSFAEIWNGRRAVALRAGIHGRGDHAEFCRLCPYTERGALGTVLACTELRPVSSL